MKKVKKITLLFTFLLFYKLSLGATFNVSTPEEFITALNEAVQNGEEDKIILSSGDYYFFEPLSIEVSDKKSLSIVGEDPDNRPKLYFDIPANIFSFFINYPENKEPGYLKFKNLVFTVYNSSPFGLFIKTYQKDIIFENCLISKFSFEGLEAISKKGNLFFITSKIEDIFDDITPDERPTYIGPETLVAPMRNNIYILGSSLFSEFYTKGSAGDIKVINSNTNYYNEEGLYFNGKHVEISFSNFVFGVGRGYEKNSLNIEADTVEIHNSKLNKVNITSNNISLVSNKLGTEDPRTIDPYYTYLKINFDKDINSKAIYNIVNNTIGDFITVNSETDTEFNFYNNITLLDITANMKIGKSNSFKFFNNIFSENVNFGTPSGDYFDVNSGNIHLKNVSDLVVSGNIFNVKDINQIKLLAKDSGYNNAPRLEDYPYDIDNDVRIYGENVDIGANEFVDPDKKESKLLFAYLLPTSTNVNRPIYLAFSVFAKDNDNLTCEVDFNNDGTPDYTKENCKGFQYVSHIYKQAGTYPIKLTVKNGDRFIARKDFLATVSNVEGKLLNIHVDVGNLDEENNLPVRVSMDNDFPVVCKWHIKYVGPLYSYKYKGLYYGGGIVTDCSSTTLKIDNAKNVYVFLEVDDAKGNVIDLLPVKELNLSNQTFKSYPTAKVHLNKTKGYIPLTVQLELEPIINETPPKTCYIDFDGDGNYEKTINDCYQQTYQFSYTYENPGTYILKIVFEDENGNTATKTFQIIASRRTINNPPKIKDFRYTREGRVPLYATFKIEVEDPDGDAVKCKIDFDGDGTFDKTIENCDTETVHHVYTDPGTYRPIVLAEDFGNQKSVKTGYILVHEFYKKILPKENYYTTHLYPEIFEALKKKYKLPDTLKDRSFVILVYAKPKQQNGTIYLYPNVSNFPLVGEEFIAKNDKYDFPFGLINVKVEPVVKGSKVCIAKQIPGYIPENAIFVKYNKDGSITPIKNVYSSYDGINWKKGLVPGYRIIKYCALEGGRFDEDGVANGVFVDPAGLAVPTGSYNPSNPPNNNQGGGNNNNSYNPPNNNNNPTNNIRCSGSSGCFLNKNAPLSDILPFAIILFVFLLRKRLKGGEAV